MNNGDNTNNELNNNIPNAGVQHEEIKAAKVYKLSPENAPQEIPKTEEPIWKRPKEEKVPEEKVEPIIIEKKVKEKNVLARILFIIIVVLLMYIVFSHINNKNTINKLIESSSPISTLGEEKELSLDNPIVLDLYSKVKTNIREDIAENELNESLKLYLSYRAIPNDKVFESNCTGFDNSIMIPFYCTKTSNKLPNAFKKESLLIEYVKLFGENENFKYENIQIGRNCIGGYQYVESRGEYVQGFCTQQVTTIYNADKKLIKATTKASTITLIEEVKYSASEGQALPETLKSGRYIYTFKLDKNYNYIYISKVLQKED